MRIGAVGPLLIFLTLSLLIYFLSHFFVGHYLNGAALVLLIAVCSYWLFFLDNLWVYFIYVFAFAFAAVSGFAIEYFGLYMFEVRYSGELTGASATVASFMSLFLSSSFLATYLSKNLRLSLPRIRYIDGMVTTTFVLVSCLLLLLMVLIVGLYGSPLFMGIDRFTFWAEIAPEGTSKLRYFLLLSSFFISCAHVFGKIRLSTSVLWITISLLTLVLHGEKMSGLILILYFYLIPYFSLKVLAPSPIKIFIVGGVAVLAFLSIVLGNYITIQGDFTSALDLFLARASLQGQMNYAILQHAENGGAPLTGLIQSFFGFDVERYSTGIYYFMDLIAPPDVVERRLQQGTTFTAPFPANIIYFFGPILSIIVVIIFSIIVWFLSWLLVLSLRSRNFIFSLISVIMWYYTYGAIVMGNVNKLFEWKFLLMWFCVSILLIIGSRNVIPSSGDRVMIRH